jgi:hypothetical protein
VGPQRVRLMRQTGRQTACGRGPRERRPAPSWPRLCSPLVGGNNMSLGTKWAARAGPPSGRRSEQSASYRCQSRPFLPRTAQSELTARLARYSRFPARPSSRTPRVAEKPNSVASVRERTSCQFLRLEAVAWSAQRIPKVVFSDF